MIIIKFNYFIGYDFAIRYDNNDDVTENRYCFNPLIRLVSSRQLKWCQQSSE